MSMARGGKYRHVATVQTATETQDAQGQKIKTWTSETTTRRCAITALTGDELFNAQKVVAHATHRFEMRYAPLNTTQRLLAKGKTFHILSVKDINEKQRYSELMCKEVESDLIPVVNDDGMSVFNDAGSQVYVAR